MTKQNSGCNANRYNFAVCIICIATVLIVLFDAYCICYFIKADPQNAAGALEASLITTGLSIIAIAISVWAALNIVNTLDRKDLEDMQRRLNELKAAQDQVNRQKEEYEITLNSIKAQNRNLFFFEMGKCVQDYGMQYFSNKFLLRNQDAIPFDQISVVMQYFASVLQQRNQNKKLIMKISEDGKNKCEELLKIPEIKNEELVYKFVEYCKAEFIFYLSSCENKTCRKDDILEAIHIYQSFLVHPEHSLDKELRAYLQNTIGECYNMAARSDQIEEEYKADYKNLAFQYCKKAGTKQNEKEVYIRNYAVALENNASSWNFDDKKWKEAYCQYSRAIQFAIDTQNIPYNCFYAYLSFYRKHMDTILMKGKKEVPDKNLYKLDENWKSMISATEFAGIIPEFMRNAKRYAELAQKVYPEKMVFRKHSAMIQRDYIIVDLINGDQSSAMKKWKNFTSDLNDIYFLCTGKNSDQMEHTEKIDSYMTQLLADRDVLAKYFE